MKKVFVVFLCFIVAFAVNKEAFAEDITYKITGEDISIKIPDNWLVITRDNEVDEKTLEILDGWGLTIEEAREELKANNLHLNAIDGLYNLVLSFQYGEGYKEIGNLSEFSKEEKELAVEITYNELIKQNKPGIEYVDWHGYETDNGTYYICVEGKYESNGMKFPVKEYFTVYNDRAISINIFSEMNNFEEPVMKEIEGIISSISFGEQEETASVKQEDKNEMASEEKQPVNTENASENQNEHSVEQEEARKDDNDGKKVVGRAVRIASISFITSIIFGYSKQKKKKKRKNIEDKR